MLASGYYLLGGFRHVDDSRLLDAGGRYGLTVPASAWSRAGWLVRSLGAERPEGPTKALTGNG